MALVVQCQPCVAVRCSLGHHTLWACKVIVPFTSVNGTVSIGSMKIRRPHSSGMSTLFKNLFDFKAYLQSLESCADVNLECACPQKALNYYYYYFFFGCLHISRQWSLVFITGSGKLWEATFVGWRFAGSNPCGKFCTYLSHNYKPWPNSWYNCLAEVWLVWRHKYNYMYVLGKKGLQVLIRPVLAKALNFMYARMSFLGSYLRWRWMVMWSMSILMIYWERLL